MQEKIEAIRKACIEANPSILDLVFGCELKRNDQYESVYRCINEVGFAHNDKKVWLNSVPFGSMEVERDRIGKGLDFEILGRPIRLADILYLAFKNELNHLGGPLAHNMTEAGRIVAYWSLFKDDLTLQSPETIDFLYQLLITK